MPSRLVRKPAKPSKVVGRGIRKQTYASLKRQADAAFSEWVRRFGAELEASAGLARCVTCREVMPWQRLQCGHFISRVHLSTRYDERNCAPQCYACNVLRRGNPGEFALYLTNTYGPQILEELVAKKRSQIKLTRSDLISIRDSYKQKLAELG